MIRIQQLKLPVTHTQEELEQKIRKTLKIGKHDLQEIELLRRSIDARKKSELKYVYQLDVKVKDENAVLRKAKNNQIVKAEKKPYVFPKSGEQTLVHRPVIIGSGPAGLFCAYVLAKHGYRPLVLERGESAEQRKKSVDAFWKTGVLNPESNVQFGEGGAGTFSDGKLNTSVKDPSGRNREVLRIFTECGAPEEILYDQKPHLGTDQLIGIVTTMRKKIEAWGGEVRFGAKVTDFGIENGRLTSVTVNETEKIAAETAVLAIGHSARDTFFKLCENKISMEAKSFAVGVRIEHPQKMITEDQYGPEAPDFLGAAPYKLTNQCENGRGVYSFCMCPGGYVVNASSEAERTCVNGMSYSDREGKNANSAMIVTVTPEDYRPYHVEGTPDVLDGVAFQRALEHIGRITPLGHLGGHIIGIDNEPLRNLDSEMIPGANRLVISVILIVHLCAELAIRDHVAADVIRIHNGAGFHIGSQRIYNRLINVRLGVEIPDSDHLTIHERNKLTDVFHEATAAGAIILTALTEGRIRASREAVQIEVI